MSRTVYRISIVLHAFWLLAASPVVAADPPSDTRDDFDRWIPSLALSMGFSTQRVKGSVDSSQEVAAFGQIFDFPIGEREFNDNQKSLNNILIGGILELQTPQLFSPKWSPRIFFGGEISHVSSQKRQIAREGDPSDLNFEPPSATFPDEAILGQGQATTADADTVLYGASIGISFPFEVRDWRISIKPQARYLHQKIDFSGVVLDAERDGFPGDDPTRKVEIFGSDSIDVDAVGPALEIEIDAARVGSLNASIFFNGGAYKVLSDRKTAFSSRTRDNLDTGDYRGDWTAEVDPWIYRANAGFRVKWLGLSSGWLGGGN
jgi:hypothetical protein